jgi:hypothetical protein
MVKSLHPATEQLPIFLSWREGEVVIAASGDPAGREGNRMAKFFRKLSLVFSSGCFGGIANGLVVWVFGVKGITASLGVKIAPQLTAPYLYHRLVWGGIWGVLFMLPLWRRSIFGRGLLYSLGPTAVQLFVVFPHLGKGAWGIELGYMTPLFVLFFNAVWGVFTAAWLRMAED